MTTLREQLAIDEGERKSAYQDSLGYWTIGIGRMIDARLSGGLSKDEIQYLLTNDLATAQSSCRKLYPKFAEFSQARQDALMNMMFNLGIEKMKLFIDTIARVNTGDWVGVQEGLKHTLWYKQVGARADRIIKQLGS